MKKLITIIILLLPLSLSEAEMYKWTADDGSITFKDTPPPTSLKRKKIKIYNDNDFASTPVLPPEPESSTNKKKTQQVISPKPHFSGTVEIFITDWCGYCKQAMSYMKSNNITYVAFNIEKDPTAKQRYKELGGRGVPLLVIGSNTMSGFSPNTFEYYLNKVR